MNKRAEKVKAWRRRYKQKLLSLKGNKCCICGYDKCLNALSFHHINPEEKEFGLSEIRANPIGWEKVLKEVEKCILVCNNCHAEIHEGITKIAE